MLKRSASFLFLLKFCLMFLMMPLGVLAAFDAQQSAVRSQLQEASKLGKQQALGIADHIVADALQNYNGLQLIEVVLQCARLAIDKGSVDVALRYVDLVSKEAANENVAIPVADLNYILGTAKFLQHRFADAERLYLKGIDNIATSADAAIEGYLFWGLGKSSFAQRKYTSAAVYYDKAMDFSVKHVDDGLRINVLLHKGILMTRLASFPKAIEMHLLVNELANKQSNMPLVSASLNQVGVVYLSVGQYAKAQDAFFSALNGFESVNDSLGMAQALSNLGDVYYHKNMASQAIDFSLKSLRLSEKLKDTLAICLTKVNIGQIELKRGQPQLALKHFMQASELSSNLKDASLASSIHFNMGQVYLTVGNTAAAIDALRSAVGTAERLGERGLQAKGYDALSSAYESTGDYVSALRAKSEFAMLKDSILNEQTIEYVARMDAIYRTIQRENIIKNLKAQNEDVVKTLEQEKVSKLGFWLAIGILLLVLAAMLIVFKVKQQAGRRLKEVNEELARLNAAKDKFFSIISHDLRSPINSIMGFSEMIALHAESGHTDKLVDLGTMVHQSTKKLFSLVDNLLLWSRTQVGATPYKPQQIDVGIQCQNIMSLMKLNAEEKDILIIGKLEKGLMAFADVNLFNTILRNLISNAIKFSPVGATVTISTKEQNKQIVVTVSDTGVGIAPENLPWLFNIDTNTSTNGTFNEKGSGLGLILCKEFVGINKGTIHVESEQGKGSAFVFTVPLG